MVELGELEKRHGDFEARGVRVVVASSDDLSDAKATQTDFPHLVVLSDHDQALAQALEVLSPQDGPDGRKANAPTTFVMDGTGTVRWVYRPGRFIERLSPDELLAGVEKAGVSR
jgi:peroxiredoxin